MKKKIMLTLFAAIFVSLASFGQFGDSYAVNQNGDRIVLQQEELLLFHTGTMFDYNSVIPVFGGAVDRLSKSQFIIPQAQISALTYAEINQLTFYATGARDWGEAVFEVYLKEVYFDEFANLEFYDWEEMTLVYSGGLYIDSERTMTVPFDNGFTYEGGSLIIGIKQTVVGTKSNCNWRGVTTSYNAAIGGYGQSDYSFYKKLPRLTITYTPQEAPLCDRPHNLVINESFGTYVVMNWMAGEGQSAWQLAYSTSSSFNPDETTPININECPYTLTGLTPETEYYAYLRTDCGDGVYSDWSDLLTFTTAESCLTPYNLHLLGEDGSSAEIGWTDLSDTHVLRYKENGNVSGDVLLFCDFETALSSDWTIVDYDNDGFSWTQDNNSYTSYQGDGCMYSLSYDHSGQNGYFLNPDNWLITPSVALGGSVTFYAKGKKVGEGIAHEHFAVYVSTTDTSIESFTQVSPEYITTSDYALYSVDLSDYSGVGYIAIRHFSASHMLSLSIDNFTVYAGTTHWTEVTSVGSSPYVLGGLSPRAFYEVQVKAVCSTESSSRWSESLHFNTTIDCGNVVVDYAHPFYEGFEGSTFPPACWTAESDGTGCYWKNYVLSGSYSNNNHQGNHTGSASAFSGYYNEVDLVMPEMTIVGYHATLTFWSYNTYTEEGGTNSVLISTDGGNSFVTIRQVPLNTNWIQSTISLNNYVNQSVVIAFRYNSGGGLGHAWYVDDVAITATCSKEFVTDGNWNVAANWLPQGVPTPNQSVLISAAATIPSGCVVEANSISIAGNGSLTIADGGQLIHNTTDVYATVKKSVTGYGVSDNGWNLIASPVVGRKAVANVHNIIATDAVSYDLYKFNQSEIGEEWQNYKEGTFVYMWNGMGFLYANAETVSLEFEGNLVPSMNPVSVALEYDPSSLFSGWNLVGNPFSCNAYFEDGNEFYRMNEEGSELILADGVVYPCEGVFVKATASEQNATFTRTAPSNGGGRLSFNLNGRNGQTINRARVHFNGSRDTEVFGIRPNSTKLFFSKEGKDFAAVGSETSSGELPLNFKAAENGTYTITVNCEEQMSYVHLIDNLTGADIDLLATPTYTFESKVTDYASRFKVVFVAQSDETDHFAFVSNGQLVILDVDLDSDVQIIDMTGRVVLHGKAMNSSLSLEGVASGVYVVRLTNGGEVKTQKIVVGTY